MQKLKQRIGDLRCEITAITTQRESLDAMQQLELFGLKERLRELESLQIETNDIPSYTPIHCMICNKHKSHIIINEKQGECVDCNAVNWRCKQ